MSLPAVNSKIKFVREYLLLSSADFAHYLGISQEQVRLVETPGAEIPAAILMVLLQKMNVSADWLLTGQGSMFTQSGPLRFPSCPERIPAKVLQLNETELDERIRQLEESIQTETSLSLMQIRGLFARLLHLEIAPFPAETAPLIPGICLDRLSFYEKAAYYQELQSHVRTAHQRFLQYFSQLISLNGQDKAE